MARDSKREAQRLKRKKELAKADAQRFEDELSAHELVLARLDAIPEASRDNQWQPARDDSVQAIAILSAAIEVSLSEAEKPDQTGS